MRRPADPADIAIVLEKLRSYYLASRFRRNNMVSYYFNAKPQEILELTQLAIEHNAINFNFEIPHKQPIEAQSFFDFIVNKFRLSQYSTPEEHAAFEQTIQLFILNDINLGQMFFEKFEVPVTTFSKTINIHLSSFLKMMLNEWAFKTSFSEMLSLMSNAQLQEICVQLSQLETSTITLAALKPEFHRKLFFFSQEVAKRNIPLEHTIKQTLKTMILLLCETAENCTKKPDLVENDLSQKLRFPFGNGLIQLYQLFNSNDLIYRYFYEDPLFLNCLAKKTIFPWISNNDAIIPWDFLSQVMLETYSTEKFMQTFIGLTHLGLAHHVIKLKTLSIQSSDESWILYANRLIRTQSIAICDKEDSNTLSTITVKKNNELKERLTTYVYHSALGRTLIFSNENDYIAIKIQKKEEATTELEKEYYAMTRFRQRYKKLKLQSTIPEALGIYLLTNKSIIELLPEKMGNAFDTLMTLTSLNADTTTDQQTHCLLYKVENYDYFTYLHDPKISGDNFALANDKIVNDLAETLKNGIVFDRLADIFHTHENKESRTDHGRYLVLVALLRRHHAIHLRHSSGRVDRWQEAIRYVNLRATGLADLGDYCTSQEFYEKPWFQEINSAYTSPDDPITQSYSSYKNPDKDCNALINANIIAEYLFILTLICGKRACSTKDNLWTTMAEQIVNNATRLISLLTPISQAQARHYMLSFISIDRLAKQMQYWMTPGYAIDFAAGVETYQKKLSAIYEPGVTITFNVTDRTSHKMPVQYFSEIGLSVDGLNQDLGAFNAQNPMKEDNKIYYMTPALINLLNTLTLNFRNAFEQFESAIVINHFKNALDAIQLLKLNSFPHSAWQKKCIAFSYVRTLRAAHSFAIFQRQDKKDLEKEVEKIQHHQL